MTHPYDVTAFYACSCECGECGSERSDACPNDTVDSPRIGGNMEAMSNPPKADTDSPIRHIPRPVMDAIDRAMIAAWRHGSGSISNHEVATVEAEMWECVADAFMSARGQP